MSKTIIKAKAKQNESNANLLRRFSRRVRDAGIVNKARSIRFHERDYSKTRLKKEALRKIGRRQEVEKLIKLGKLRDTRSRKIDLSPKSKQEGRKNDAK